MNNRSVKYILMTIVLLIFGMGFSQTGERTAKVKYLSADHVYIDAGETDGLSAGMRLSVIRQAKIIAEMEIVFVAGHSSSCKIIESSSAVKAGDIVHLPDRGEISEAAQDTLKSRQRALSQLPVKSSRRSRSNVHGTISMQLYHFEDLTDAGLNFSQPTFRVNLKARQLWGKSYHFILKTRTRYDKRERSYNSHVPSEEWRNRIYELSFSYDDESSVINYKLGRIISNKFSGVGYIDGLLLQYNMLKNLSLGVFAGTQPEWQYSDFQTSIQKYGGYLTYLTGDYSTKRLESTLALAGEYHGSTVSREFLYLQNNYVSGKKWSFYQSAEIDLNRDWRKDRTNENLSLSGLYLSGRYRFSDGVNASLSYDNRKNYYTYDLRTMADSLFDDAFRQGIRTNIHIKLLDDYRLSAGFGIRNRENDSENTYSYSAGLNKMNFFLSGMLLQLNLSGFSNYYTSGYNPSIRISKTMNAGHIAGITYGNYFYNLEATNSNYLNQWLRVNGQIELTRHFFISSQYEYDWGDDTRGHRVNAEAGFRF
ncbi:MAG: hypothetical protein AB7W47_12950 [Calditrichaceae bacterium]